MGQVWHWFALCQGIVFRCPQTTSLCGMAQPIQQGIYATLESFKLSRQLRQVKAAVFASGVAVLQLIRDGIERTAGMACQPPQAQAQQQHATNECCYIDAHKLYACARGSKTGVQYRQPTQNNRVCLRNGTKENRYIAHPFNAHLAVAPQRGVFRKGNLSVFTILNVGYHVPVIDVFRAWAKCRVEARPAKIAGKPGPHGVCCQAALGQTRVWNFRLKEHPAVAVKKKRAHAHVGTSGSNGGIGGRIGRNYVPQLPQVEREHQVAHKCAIRILHRGRKAQHMQGDILVTALNRHHRVGDFYRLRNAHMPNTVLCGNAVEGAGRAGKSLAHGDIDNVAFRIDQQIAFVRGKAFKGKLSIT